MAYLLVFVGSFIALCIVGALHVLLRQRGIRRFVRGIRQRFDALDTCSILPLEEVQMEKSHKSPRISAIELQQVHSLLRAAERMQAQGKDEEVERLLIQALTIQPHARDVKAQLAKLYLSTGRESKAEAMYKELLQEHSDVSFHANLGLAFYRQAKYVEACYSYQEALNRDPRNPERSAALGRACIAALRFDEAAPLLEKACLSLTRDMELLHLLAECYLQLQNHEKAEETYRRINKLEPYNEDVKEKLLSLAQA